MNYLAVYWKLILRAQRREYPEGDYEIHHIIPRSYGGSNKKDNKVALTPKEHHVAHLLLVKMGWCSKYWFSNISNREYEDLKRKEKYGS